MTKFGKNIKKIRSIQKLSQSNFAEIFNLSRASIGAYEEGRAEPKLEVVINIANHFSISVDNLLNNDITVNELYHFNIFDENISGKINIGSEVLKKIEFTDIPLIIPQELLINDVAACHCSAKNFITIPHHTEKHLAILIDKNGFKYLPSRLKDNDIIIVYIEFEVDKYTNISENLWLIKSDKSLFLGETKRINRDTYLFFPEEKAPISLSRKEIEFILPFETYISKKPRLDFMESDKLTKLELQVNDLYNRL